MRDDLGSHIFIFDWGSIGEAIGSNSAACGIACAPLGRARPIVNATQRPERRWDQCWGNVRPRPFSTPYKNSVDALVLYSARPITIYERALCLPASINTTFSPYQRRCKRHQQLTKLIQPNKQSPKCREVIGGTLVANSIDLW